MGKDINEASRQKSWLAVAVTSAVALASIVSQIRADNRTSTPAMKYIVAAAAITMAIAARYALAYSFHIDNQGDDTSSLNLMEKGCFYWKKYFFIRNKIFLKIEVFYSIVNLVLWALAIAFIFHQTDLAATSTAPYIITNANIYYFSWASLLFSAVVVGDTYESVHKCFGNVTARFNMWGLLVITSIVSMASGTNWWKDSSCKTATTKTTLCKDVELAFAFGAIVAGLSLLTMMAAFCMKERKNAMLMWEAFVAIVGVVLWASATRRLTQPNAPASVIGNLYYFTWLSLLVSIMLLWDTIVEKFKPASDSNTETAEVANEEMEAKSTPPPEAVMPETQAAPVGETQV